MSQPEAASCDQLQPPSETLRSYARGMAGGLIFSLPLLYTQETWAVSSLVPPQRLLILMAITFLLLLGYNRFDGLRDEATLHGLAFDAVIEMGLGLLLSAGLLLLLARLEWNHPLSENLARVVTEGMLIAIGISVGTAQLGLQAEENEKEGKPDDRPEWLGQMLLAVCGAVLFATNIAPTDEVPLLARQLDDPHLLCLLAFSLAVAAVVLFFSDFKGSHPPSGQVGRAGLAAASYGVAFTVSAATLWFFGRFDAHSFDFCLRQTVALAFPATLGASAGRLLLQ